jgi:heme/copper-type cytochrome/quinol oxidase subunit 4
MLEWVSVTLMTPMGQLNFVQWLFVVVLLVAIVGGAYWLVETAHALRKGGRYGD